MEKKKWTQSFSDIYRQHKSQKTREEFTSSLDFEHVLKGEKDRKNLPSCFGTNRFTSREKITAQKEEETDQTGETEDNQTQQTDA